MTLPTPPDNVLQIGLDIVVGDVNMVTVNSSILEIDALKVCRYFQFSDTGAGTSELNAHAMLHQRQNIEQQLLYSVHQRAS